MTLYESLLYNWERGFYSVVKHVDGGYLIVTAPRKQQYPDWHGDTEGIQYTAVYPTVEEAKDNVFNCELCLSRSNPCAQEEPKHWEIIDTIHPSELMGKGFQVGDKVGFNINRLKGKTGLIVGKNEGKVPPAYNILIGDDAEWLLGQYLKPVLPVEEREICMKCGVTINPNDIGVLRTGTDYLCCYDCDKEVIKVIELLKKTRVIKDGHIVNL